MPRPGIGPGWNAHQFVDPMHARECLHRHFRLPPSDLAAISVAVAVFGILADMLDGHHMLVLGGVEHDDALGRPASDPDALDWAADQLTLVGHQHDLVRLLDREGCYQLAVPAIDGNRHDAFSAAAGGSVFVG